MVKAFTEILRDFATDGVPSSGPHQPIKADFREALTAVEAFSNASGSALVYQDRTTLFADLAHAANTMAWVVNDATTAYNGIYQKSGASGAGSWTRVADLPYSFIVATNSGAGTANAIQATTAIPVTSSALVLLPIVATASNSPITVSFNGDTALTIKTVSGNSASALTTGMWILGNTTGSDFRMLNDQDVAALVAQAETARDEAVAAAAAFPAIVANTMLVDNAAGTARESKTFPEVKTILNLNNTTRAFNTSSDLLLATVDEDHITVADVPMKAASDGTFLDSVGKKFKPAFWVTPRLFGAIGDGGSLSGTDDVVAIQAAWTYASDNKIPCLMEGLSYNVSDQLTESSTLFVDGYGSVIYPFAWPKTGGLITNVHPTDPLLRVVEDIHIRGLTCDGSLLPHPYLDSAIPDQSLSWLSDIFDFSSVSWVKTGASVTANTTLAPDGTTTADTLVEDTSTGSHVAAQITGPSTTIGEEYCFSVYAKAGTRTKIGLSLSGTAFGTFLRAEFDLSNGSIITTPSGMIAVDIRDAGDGWYQLTVSREATVAGTFNCGIYILDTSGASSYTGDGVSGFSLWGAFARIVQTNNTNFFDGARGHYRATYEDCVGRKLRDGIGGGTGGGAFGMEQGAHDILYLNCTAEDCYRAFRVSGISGSFADAAAELKSITNNRCINLTAKRCGHAIIAHAAGDTTSWNTTDLSRFDATFDGVNVEDCGHYPWRFFDFVATPSISPQKTGIFVFFGAQGIKIKNVRIKLSSGYTTGTDWLGRTGYPAGGTNYIGAGLSGNVGAIVRGWGRDCTVENITFDGSVDTYWMFDRAVTAGDIGSSVPTSVATGLRGNNIIVMDHVAGGTSYMFDCPAGITDANFRSRLEGIRVNAAPTSALGGANAVALNNVFLEFGNRDGTKIRGRLAELITRNVNLVNFQQDFHLAGGMSLGAGYGSVGVRDGWTNDGQIWRTSAATTATTTKMAFYNPNGLVGQIRTTTSGVDYVTTSDEDEKIFIGEYDWREAFRIIKADPVREFDWKNSGERAVGWGAQTSYSVSHDLASPGGWLGPDGLPCNEETEGAEYIPWGVDMARRTPYLWAAVSKLIDRCEELNAQIEMLKKQNPKI